MASLESELIDFGYENFPHLLTGDMDVFRTNTVRAVVGWINNPYAVWHHFWPPKGKGGMTTWALVGAVWLCSKTEEYEPDYMNIKVRFLSRLDAWQCNKMIGTSVPDGAMRRWCADGRLQFWHLDDPERHTSEKEIWNPTKSRDETLPKVIQIVDGTWRKSNTNLFQACMPLCRWNPKSEYFKQQRLEVEDTDLEMNEKETTHGN